MLLALDMEESSLKPKWVIIRSGKGREMVPPLETLKRKQPC